MKNLFLVRVIMILVVGFGAGILKADSDTAPLAGAPPQADPLAQIESAIAQDPTDAENFIVRGNIYCKRKMWDAAQDSYEKALALEPNKAAIRMDLAELQFRRKQYDAARASFVLMASDKDLGDLASYMVFLCDLFGNHEDTASQELAAFNAAGERPSYYFSNVAWDLAHHDLAGARDYLDSAEHIYSQGKSNLYAVNLVEMGYLPLKD